MFICNERSVKNEVRQDAHVQPFVGVQHFANYFLVGSCTLCKTIRVCIRIVNLFDLEHLCSLHTKIIPTKFRRLSKNRFVINESTCITLTRVKRIYILSYYSNTVHSSINTKLRIIFYFKQAFVVCREKHLLLFKFV